MFKQTTLSVLVGLIFTTAVQAEEGFIQHEAHVHGSVEMNIAQDGHDLLIEITSPGMDIVGFEHHAESEQDQQKVANAIKTLQAADTLIKINPQANCKLGEVHVHAPGDEEEHDHDEHEHHDHDDAHADHEHEHEHDEDTHSDHEGHDHEHSEFTVEYEYHCENAEQINSLSTTWFNAFPSTHDIDVNIFTEKRQAAVEVSASNPSIEL